MQEAMPMSKKNKATRLSEAVFISLIWILGDWIFRGRGRNTLQVLIDSFPFVVGAAAAVFLRRRDEETEVLSILAEPEAQIEQEK
jgi:hypothetical protein